MALASDEFPGRGFRQRLWSVLAYLDYLVISILQTPSSRSSGPNFLPADVIARAVAVLDVVQASTVRAFGPSSKRVIEAARAWGSDAEWEQVRSASLKSDQVAALLALLAKWSAALGGESAGPALPGAAAISSEAVRDGPSVSSSSDSPVGLSLSAADWDATREFLANRHSAEQAAS